MSTYVVEVTVRHLVTYWSVKTRVEVDAPYDRPQDALLLAAQLASTHRLGWTPIKTQIVEMEA